MQEPAGDVSGHWHGQQGTAEHRSDSLGSCWAPVRDPDLLALLCHHPHDSARATHLPNPKRSVWTQSEQGRSSQLLNRGCLPFQGGSLVWCPVPASSRKDEGVEMRICVDTASAGVHVPGKLVP